MRWESESPRRSRTCRRRWVEPWSRSWWYGLRPLPCVPEDSGILGNAAKEAVPGIDGAQPLGSFEQVRPRLLDGHQRLGNALAAPQRLGIGQPRERLALVDQRKLSELIECLLSVDHGVLGTLDIDQDLGQRGERDDLRA